MPFFPSMLAQKLPPEAASVELHELDVLEAADLLLTCLMGVVSFKGYTKVPVYQVAVLKG